MLRCRIAVVDFHRPSTQSLVVQGEVKVLRTGIQHERAWYSVLTFSAHDESARPIVCTSAEPRRVDQHGQFNGIPASLDLEKQKLFPGMEPLERPKLCSS